MADSIPIDNVRPTLPSAWQNDVEIVTFFDSDFFRQEQTIERTGNETDLVADSQNRVDAAETNISTINSSLSIVNTEIVTLQEAVAELEELIVLLQKRIKTTTFTLEQMVKCLEEKMETD